MLKECVVGFSWWRGEKESRDDDDFVRTYGWEGWVVGWIGRLRKRNDDERLPQMMKTVIAPGWTIWRAWWLPGDG